MPANFAYPFIIPADDLISAGSWLVKRNDVDDRIPLEMAFSSWDYNISFDLHRRIALKPLDIFKQCGLGDDSILKLIVTVSTAGGALRRDVFSSEIEASDEVVKDLDISIEGTLLKGDLILKTMLVIKSAPEVRLPFSPKQSGSILWNDSFVAPLEGSLSRLPMTTLDFTKFRKGIANAPWMLQWNPLELELNAAANLRLYLNSARPDILEQVRNCSKTICSFMIVDLVRQILTRLIIEDEFDGRPDSWPEHSLGRMASDWFASIFPDQTVPVIRERLQADSGYFEATIHSFFGGQNAS